MGKKYLKITTLFLIIFAIFTTSCFAVDGTGIKEYFANGTTNLVNSQNQLDFDTIKNTFYTILRYVGWAVAVCIILVVGIQFLTANAQKKAQLKEKLWLIILGVFILAAGPSLLNLIADILTKASEQI